VDHFTRVTAIGLVAQFTENQLEFLVHQFLPDKMKNRPQDDSFVVWEGARGRMILEQLQRTDDFGFELRTKGVIEAAGGLVTHGWTYIDPIEEKPRQFDLRAKFLNFGTERHHLFLAAECKNLDPVAPLVISGITRSKKEAFYDFVRADRTNGLRQYVMRVQSDCELYPQGGFVGKSLLRLKLDDKAKDGPRLVQASDKESDIFGRWSQALASSADLCREAAWAGESSEKVHDTLIIPAVVVPDGSLWTVEYNSDGTVREEPKMAQATTIFVNHEITIVPRNLWINLSHVHFFTLAGVRDFLRSDGRFPQTDWFPATAESHQPQVH
jgi:hypothetical protein